MQINKELIGLNYPKGPFIKFTKWNDQVHTTNVWLNKMMIMSIEETHLYPTIVMFDGSRIVVNETLEEILKKIQ